MNCKVYSYMAAVLAIALVPGTAAKADSFFQVDIAARTLTANSSSLTGPTCSDGHTTPVDVGQPSRTLLASCPLDLFGDGPASASATGSASRVVVGSQETFSATFSGNGSAARDPNPIEHPNGFAFADAEGSIRIDFLIDEPTNVSISINHSLNGVTGLFVSLSRNGQEIGLLCPTCDPPVNSLPTAGVFQPGAYQLRGNVDGESFQGTGQGTDDRPTFSFSLGITVSIGGCATAADCVEEGLFHWINPAGGSYAVGSNWDPAGIPVHDGVRSDTAIFDLNTGSPIPVNAAAATAGKWRVLNGTYNVGGPAEVFALFKDNISLEVSNGGHLMLTQSTLRVCNPIM